MRLLAVQNSEAQHCEWHRLYLECAESVRGGGEKYAARNEHQNEGVEP
jgi:hypothetical protein